MDAGINLSDTCLLDRWLSVLRLQECGIGSWEEQENPVLRCKTKNTSSQIGEYESRDEQYRCGRIRSSEEADVMSVERRGSVIKTS